MDFYVLSAGQPILNVHKWSNKDQRDARYDVYVPPERDTPYLFGREYIYAILFVRKESAIGSMDTTIKVREVLDLLFSKRLKDYQSLLGKILDLSDQTPVLITDKQVYTLMQVRGPYAGKEDAIIGVKEQQLAASLFMNIVNKKLDNGTEYQKAFEYAIETGIFGDFFNASVPRWYERGRATYGTSSTEEAD